MLAMAEQRSTAVPRAGAGNKAESRNPENERCDKVVALLLTLAANTVSAHE
jgi:hypothetical protein